ncbi:hypothetical protein [Nocardioides marmoraquaticus]
MTLLMTVEVSGIDGIERLQDDLRTIARRSVTDSRALMRRAGMVGNTVAKDSARRTAGDHGKRYPNAFTHESGGGVGFGGAGFWAQYGPDASRPQGGMDFEHGPGPQTSPHLNLAKSADLMGPVLQREVRDMVDGWFWP